MGYPLPRHRFSHQAMPTGGNVLGSTPTATSSDGNPVTSVPLASTPPINAGLFLTKNKSRGSWRSSPPSNAIVAANLITSTPTPTLAPATPITPVIHPFSASASPPSVQVSASSTKSSRMIGTLFMDWRTPIEQSLSASTQSMDSISGTNTTNWTLDADVRMFLLSRFLTIPEEDWKDNNRVWQHFERAYWFYLDEYKPKESVRFVRFVAVLVGTNEMDVLVESYRVFLQFKKEIPVAGCILLCQQEKKDHVLARSLDNKSMSLNNSSGTRS